jgi:uncharacterized membrane protein YbhN (UPF0104 family)
MASKAWTEVGGTNAPAYTGNRQSPSWSAATSTGSTPANVTSKTAAALTFAMIAYNLMALFRTFILQEKTQKTLSTLRYRTFAIGAYFEKINGKLVLKIALSKKRRAWFSGLWNYSKEFEYPFILSNA